MNAPTQMPSEYELSDETPESKENQSPPPKIKPRNSMFFWYIYIYVYITLGVFYIRGAGGVRGD